MIKTVWCWLRLTQLKSNILPFLEKKSPSKLLLSITPCFSCFIDHNLSHKSSGSSEWNFTSPKSQLLWSFFQVKMFFWIIVLFNFEQLIYGLFSNTSQFFGWPLKTNCYFLTFFVKLSKESRLKFYSKSSAKVILSFYSISHLYSVAVNFMMLSISSIFLPPVLWFEQEVPLIFLDFFLQVFRLLIDPLLMFFVLCLQYFLFLLQCF